MFLSNSKIKKSTFVNGIIKYVTLSLTSNKTGLYIHYDSKPGCLNACEWKYSSFLAPLSNNGGVHDYLVANTTLV